MRLEQFSIEVPGQQTGPAVLTLYQIDNINVAPEKKRPLVIICGGGGYSRISEREKEPILLRFLAMGCSACLLEYSVAPNRFPTSLLELASAVALARKNSSQWNIDPDKIVTCGFSAGGHLAASLGVFWNRELAYGPLGLKPEDIRPNGQILGYPVISSGPKGHRRSICELLGEKADDPEALELVSLEKQVTADTPKTFLWHTRTDQTVPVENSLLLAQAFVEQGVEFELHIYPMGVHGLSLSTAETAGENERHFEPYCSTWVDMVKAWMEENFQCLSMKK